MKQIAFILIATLMTAVVAQADWTEKFSLKGDIRLRTEGIDDEKASKERWRQRIRARLKVKGEVNENVKAVLRLATGAAIGDKGNLRSTNTTNDDYGGNKAINLDQAYISWKAMDGLKIEGGKLKNGMYRVGGSDLLWDGDLTPEGGQIKYKHTSDNLTVFSNIAAYFINENSGGEENTLLGGQIGITTGENVKFTLGGSYYAINAQDSVTFAGTGGSGNTVDGNNIYLNDYMITEAFGMATFSVMDQPLSFFVNYANNSDVDANRDAILFGAKYGQTKEIGDFRFDLTYREVRKDAIFGVLADGDFNNGSTDSEGITANIRYKFAKNSVARVIYLNSKQEVSTGADIKYNRYMLDFAFKF